MLQAISGDAALLRLLRSKAFSGSVHSVFRSAVNLRNYADGNLYALVSARFGNIPDALLIEEAAFGLIDAVAGADVHAGDNALLLVGNTMLSVADCSEWVVPRPLLTVADAAFCARVAALDAFLAARGKSGGIKAAAVASAFDREMANKLAEVGSGLVAALAGGNSGKIAGWAAGLIGLGPGLTPSGDDFLVGLLAALHCSPQSAHRAMFGCLGDVVTERALKGTNAISATALKNAAAGRFPETVLMLLAEICADNPQRLNDRAAKVLAIGSSSGTDMLYGITAGLRLVAQ